MTRLSDANERLEKAIGRLDAVIAKKLNGGTSGRDKLLAELSKAKARCADLEKLTDDASSRLDATIAKLQHILKA